MNKEPEKLHNYTESEETQLSLMNSLVKLDDEVDRLVTQLENQMKEQAN